MSVAVTEKRSFAICVVPPPQMLVNNALAGQPPGARLICSLQRPGQEGSGR
jgi:hypothetical protein